MEASKANTIAALDPTSDGNKILVRVTRIWEAINKRNGTTLHTNIVLLDQQDNHIMAVVRNNQKQIYLPILKEKGVYVISNFKVVPAPQNYRAIDAEHSINFYYKTKIEKAADSDIIPLYKFELKAFSDVTNLVGNVAMLIDVIGLVKSYGKMEKRNNGAQKMDILLTDDRSANIVVTLWEDRAQQFLDMLPAYKDKPVFVVLTGLLAKKFSAAASLSSTDATRSYVNIDYAPLTALKDALASHTDDKMETMNPPKLEQFVTSTGDSVPELTIHSILETLIPQGTLAVRCICRAKIVAILDGNGWYYNCCPTCPRALKDLNGKFYCLTCDEETETLAQRFRIVVRVEDPTGSTTLTLFNKEAEQIVGVPLKKILAEQDEDDKAPPVPPVLTNIIGKMCVFQLKITPYNIIQGCEEYTVTRVSEVAEMSELTASPSTAAQTPHPAKKKQKVA